MLKVTILWINNVEIDEWTFLLDGGLVQVLQSKLQKTVLLQKVDQQLLGNWQKQKNCTGTVLHDVFPACAGGDFRQIHSCSRVLAADIDFTLKGVFFFHLQSKRFLSTVSSFSLSFRSH